VWLRSGCDLGKTSERLGLERPGGDLDELTVTAQDAVDAFHDLRDRAASAGITMRSNTIALEPIPSLAEAISFAVTAGSQDAE
jgi:CRISPR-associated protein Csb1